MGSTQLRQHESALKSWHVWGSNTAITELPQLGTSLRLFLRLGVSRVRIISFILTSLPGDVLLELSARTSGALS
jgi:hypothetical protein